MKKKCIKTFKQIYLNKEGQKKEFNYKVTIVQDTEDYSYRIMNLDLFSIWKKWKFKKYKDAEDFLNKHPFNIERQVM